MPAVALPRITTEELHEALTPIARIQASVEAWFERGLRGPHMVEQTPPFPDAPTLVRVAAQVHDWWSGGRVRLFTWEPPGRARRRGRHWVLVSLPREVTLVFNPVGVLEGAGSLQANPTEPLSWGVRWTRIRWAQPPFHEAWY